MAKVSKTDIPVLKRTRTTLTFAQQQAGLLVTDELKKAIEECTEKVTQISEECRTKNRKFRDIEFDLEKDQYRCLNTLLYSGESYSPSDVQRVTQIFENPQFYAKDGSGRANDIYQGAIGDCWFMSALAIVSTYPGLLEKFCVARDENVGVYGFIFFKNSKWINVIIDDLLYTRTPKYEELDSDQQAIYHYNKNAYNSSARKGGKQLYFAKSGDDGETWVPLLEKAYAKLHGNYASISGGEDCEAIEDMTGGVSSFIPTKDILDPDRFWTEELLRANKDRLFGCSFDALSNDRDVQGLVGSHAYSVLRAVECKGKRFVVVRNPWGKTEWNGPWSDGSKEWTREWLDILPELEHVFGDDGQFVMEYKDFLNTWQDINRTILFDDSWIMSSQWIHIPMKPLPSSWQFGDVSFTFSLSSPSLAVIVLSQLDGRYFDVISGRSTWSLDFVLVKEGSKTPLAVSNHARFYTRSVNLEIELEAGNYIVYVRIDRMFSNKSEDNKITDSNLRQLSRILSEKSKSQSIATNLKKGSEESFVPASVSDLIEKDYAEYEKKRKEKEEKEKAEPEEDNESSYTSAEDTNDSDEVTTTTTTTTVVVKKKAKTDKKPVATSAAEDPKASRQKKQAQGATEEEGEPSFLEFLQALSEENTTETKPDSESSTNDYEKYFTEDDNNLYMGLKVYTKEVPVTIEARLKAVLEEKQTEKDEKDEKNKSGEEEPKVEVEESLKTQET